MISSVRCVLVVGPCIVIPHLPYEYFLALESSPDLVGLHFIQTQHNKTFFLVIKFVNTFKGFILARQKVVEVVSIALAVAIKNVRHICPVP